MVNLLGDHPYKRLFEKICAEITSPWQNLPLNDEQLIYEGSPWQNVPQEWQQIIQNRWKLREFCKNHGLFIPCGTIVHSFEELSSWVIKRNSFPLALKSCKNSSNGLSVFRLEGFRELTKFYEILKKKFPTPIIVEDWISSDIILEITKGPGKYSLVSQIGLVNSLKIRTQWTHFPVAIPKQFWAETEKILYAFSPLLTLRSCLVRFTIGLGKMGCWLISLNGSFNRLEYFHEWCKPFGLSGIFTSPNIDKQKETPAYKYGRIQVFTQKTKDSNWPEKLPQAAENLPILKFVPAGKYLVVLLGNDNPQTFPQIIRILKNILEVEN